MRTGYYLLIESLYELPATEFKAQIQELVDKANSTNALRVEFTPQLQSLNAGEFKISNAERACLERLVFGEGNKTIAVKVGVSEATVKVHLKAGFKKLGVQNRTAAAIKIQELGLFKESGTDQTGPDKK